MITKVNLSKIKTLNECNEYLRRELFNYKTLYSNTYTDYAQREFTKQVKAYESTENYVVIISEFKGMQVSRLEVYVTHTKPRKPHPLFPIPKGFIDNYSEYHFGDDLKPSQEQTNINRELNTIKENIKGVALND